MAIYAPETSMTKRLTKSQRENVQQMITNAMQAPADDELVAAVYHAYRVGVIAGELTHDERFEAEARLHLKGTKYAI